MRLGRFSASPALRLAVLIVATLWGLISHSTYVGTGDEPHYLAIAHSLAFDRDLDLANNYGADEPLIAGGGLKPEHHVQLGRGGTLRPVHDIGLSAVFVPWVALMRPLAATLVAHLPSSALQKARLTPSTLYRHLVSTGMILITASLAVLLRRLAIGTGTPPRVAFWGSALVVLSPPFLIFGVLFFTEVLCASLLTAIVLWLFVERRWASSFIVLTGVGIGLLPFVHVRTAGLAAMLTIVAVWTLWRAHARRQAILLASVVACGVLARGALNWFLWGTLITTPHARLGAMEGARGVLSEMLIRVLGLSVDQEFGLLPYFPVAVLALWGWRSVGNEHADLGRSLLLVSAAYLVTVVSPLTNAHGWTGGWSPPARFLVPVLPLLAIVVIRGLSVAPRAMWVPLVAIQLGLNLYFFSHPKNLWNDGDGVAAVCARGGATFCGLLPSFVDPVTSSPPVAPGTPTGAWKTAVSATASAALRPRADAPRTRSSGLHFPTPVLLSTRRSQDVQKITRSTASPGLPRGVMTYETSLMLHPVYAERTRGGVQIVCTDPRSTVCHDRRRPGLVGTPSA